MAQPDESVAPCPLCGKAECDNRERQVTSRKIRSFLGCESDEERAEFENAVRRALESRSE